MATRWLDLADLGMQQAADDLLRLVLTLHGGGNDLIIGRLHPVELQLDTRKNLPEAAWL